VSRASKSRRHNRRVLIVDDQEINLRVFEARLIASGFEVQLAQRAVDAWNLLVQAGEEALPHLIILDVMMPDVSGFELLDDIKSDERFKYIPVLVVTSLSKSRHRARAFALGAEDFLTKPINASELLARVRHLTDIGQFADRETNRDLEQGKGAVVLVGRRFVAESILEDLREEGYICSNVATGEEMLTRIEQSPPDLILLANDLPSMDALNTCQKIKSNPRATHIPVMMVLTPTADTAVSRSDMSGDISSDVSSDVSSDMSADVSSDVEVTAERSVAPIRDRLAIWNADVDDIIDETTSEVEFTARIHRLLRKKQQQDAFLDHYDILMQRAITDPLTGLYNRTYLDDIINREMTLSYRSARPISFLMIDIDRFKLVNNRYGHRIGDELLKDISMLVKQHVRVSDVVSRYGGEEFAIALYDSEQRAALEVAKRICRSIAQKRWSWVDANLSITVSIGMASYPRKNNEQTDLIELAERALYQAKRLGRNRVVYI
jgi:two-component system, cell cycle response regulator